MDRLNDILTNETEGSVSFVTRLRPMNEVSSERTFGRPCASNCGCQDNCGNYSPSCGDFNFDKDSCYCVGEGTD